MKSIVVRHRNSGYTILLITPLAEDSKYWYVLETKDKGKKVDALRYSKVDFDFMGEK